MPTRTSGRGDPSYTLPAPGSSPPTAPSTSMQRRSGMSFLARDTEERLPIETLRKGALQTMLLGAVLWVPYTQRHSVASLVSHTALYTANVLAYRQGSSWFRLASLQVWYCISG